MAETISSEGVLGTDDQAVAAALDLHPKVEARLIEALEGWWNDGPEPQTVQCDRTEKTCPDEHGMPTLTGYIVHCHSVDIHGNTKDWTEEYCPR